MLGVPDCLQCSHFHVSWDPNFPRACRVFGIKSRRLPSLEVFASTGRHCPVFERSPRLRRTAPGRAGGAPGAVPAGEDATGGKPTSELREARSASSPSEAPGLADA